MWGMSKATHYFPLSFLFAFALISACLMLSGCASAPGVDQVAQIQAACAVDAGLRPTVTVLLAVPGLANVQDVAAITAARAARSQRRRTSSMRPKLS